VKIATDATGVTLIREKGDKALSHESTVTYHLRRLLNQRDRHPTQDGRAGTWRRFDPSRVGLTSCRQGLWNGRKGAGQIVYWHERYAIEDAHVAFNRHREVFYRRAT